MITQHFLSYLFNNWEETLGDEFFLLPLHCGRVVDLHLKYSMKSKMGVLEEAPCSKTSIYVFLLLRPSVTICSTRVRCF